MVRILLCVLLASSLLFARQNQGHNPPPAASPGNGSQPPAAATPHPQDKAGANSQMQSDIQSSLNSDPALSGAQVQTSVDDANITLTGTVQSQAQLERVMALVSPYIRYRGVVNKVTMK